MTTSQELIAAVRVDLQDTSTGTPRWSDEMLWQWACDAAADYSQEFPRRVDGSILTETDGSYGLPDDFVWDINVQCPSDTFLEKRRPVPGAVFKPTTSPKFYYIDGGRLYLSASTTDDVILSYYAIHSIPEPLEEPEDGWPEDEPPDFTVTVPDRDLELIRLYTCAKAHEQMRGKQARLDRFELGSGKRDDNPMMPETNKQMEEYRKKLAARKKGGVVSLYRPRRET